MSDETEKEWRKKKVFDIKVTKQSAEESNERELSI
jgi:hypothetical protein